jgi:hypothetical protein
LGVGNARRRRQMKRRGGNRKDTPAMIATRSTSESLCSASSLPIPVSICAAPSLALPLVVLPVHSFSPFLVKKNRVSGVGCRVSCQLDARVRVVRAVSPQSRLQFSHSGADQSPVAPIIEGKISEVSQLKNQTRLDSS